MGETSYPLAEGEGVTEWTYEKLMAQVTGTGRINLRSGIGSQAVASLSDKLIYGDSSGRQLKVALNAGYLMRGYRWESDGEPIVLPLEPNTSGKTRIDRAVMRLDRTQWKLRLAVLKGTPSDSPIPPALTRQFNDGGILEEPLARATVRSNAGAGLPSITAQDVADESKWFFPTPLIGHSTWLDPTLPVGAFYLAPDKVRLFAGLGGVESVIIGELSAETQIEPAAGWRNDNIWAQRVNGTTHFGCYITLDIAARTPGQDMVVCVLPERFWPRRDIAFDCTLTPQVQAGIGHIDHLTGVVTVSQYGQTFPNGGSLCIGPLQWPSTMGV